MKNLLPSIALLTTVLLAPAARAAIAITVTETEAGVIWDFQGTATTTLGPATQSVALSYSPAGNNTVFSIDKRRTPWRSALLFVESAQVLTAAPYQELRFSSPTVFLDSDSFDGSPLVGQSVSQITVGADENLEQFNFTLGSFATEIDIITYSEVAVVNRSYLMAGRTMADLNLNPAV